MLNFMVSKDQLSFFFHGKFGLSVIFVAIFGSSFFLAVQDLLRLVVNTMTRPSSGIESLSLMALDKIYKNISPLSCAIVRSNQ